MLELLIVLLMLAVMLVTVPPVGVPLACATVCGLLVGFSATAIRDVYRDYRAEPDRSGVLCVATVVRAGDGGDARKVRKVRIGAGRMRGL